MANVKKKEKKDKKGLNIFDAVVILLVVCLLGTLGYRLYSGIGKDASGISNAKYVMTFECDEEYNSLLRYLENGDAVYLASGGELLGYLYAGAEHERGAIYEILDENAVNPRVEEQTSETETEPLAVEEGVSEDIEAGVNDNYYLPTPSLPVADGMYTLIRMGGQIALNSETVRVKSGNYYSLGTVNFNVGSVIEVYTDDTVFTLKVAKISLIEE